MNVHRSGYRFTNTAPFGYGEATASITKKRALVRAVTDAIRANPDATLVTAVFHDGMEAPDADERAYEWRAYSA